MVEINILRYSNGFEFGLCAVFYQCCRLQPAAAFTTPGSPEIHDYGKDGQRSRLRPQIKSPGLQGALPGIALSISREIPSGPGKCMRGARIQCCSSFQIIIFLSSTCNISSKQEQQKCAALHAQESLCHLPCLLEYLLAAPIR